MNGMSILYDMNRNELVLFKTSTKILNVGALDLDAVER